MKLSAIRVDLRITLLYAVFGGLWILLSDRLYRPAWSREQSLAYIRSQASAHFDPQVVKTFLRMVERR